MIEIAAKKCSRCESVLPMAEFRFLRDRNRPCAMCKLCEREGQKGRRKPYVPLWVPNPLNAVLNNFKAMAEPANNGMFRRFA